MGLDLIDLEAVRNAVSYKTPYPHMLGSSVLREGTKEAISKDFPVINKSGYLAIKDIDIKGHFKKLIEELESFEMAQAVSEKARV